MVNPSGTTHEERMALALQIAEKVLARYADAVLAVFVTSSTAKRLDQQHSDLELTAVVRDGVELEDKSYVYRGVLVEIEYPQESAILKTARRVTRRWPVEADGYRNRLVLFDRDSWVRRLDEAVAERDASDFTRGWKFATTGVLEVRNKIRNAWLERDELNIHFFGGWFAESAAMLVLFLNRRYMTTTRWLLEEAFECPLQPSEFRSQIEALVGLTPTTLEQTVEAVERLSTELLSIGRAVGISVESPELIV